MFAEVKSFDSPGKVSVGGSAISLTKLPKSSSNPPLTQDNNVQGVVSFKLVPTGNIVCVTDVHPADKVHIN